MTARPALRFLVVDDFEMMRTLARKALRELGHTNVDEAASGREALAKIMEAANDRLPYAVVLCDWMMPDLTGFDVVTTCRSLTATENLPIIMVTAESEHREVIQALKAGATDYIVKPVSIKILQDKIQRVLQRANITAA